MSSIPQKKVRKKSPRKSSSASTPEISIKLKHHQYVIDIGHASVDRLAHRLDALCTDRRALILSNTVVGQLYLRELRQALSRVDIKAPCFLLPDGEQHKTLKTVETCYQWMFEQRADRQSVLVLLGGGVLGDVGGYVAATYMRGIRFVQVPTSLVAQVDSSIGGKVGVDHSEGKNLIGAFYQPEHVHIDVGYLATLSEREFLCGLAEVIKYAVIRDPRLHRFLQTERIAVLRRDAAALEYIVRTCCKIKARVVKQDEKEVSGQRMILNFGHTVGHVIERLTRYRKFGHGEAVAMGMVAAAEVSEHLGLTDKETVRAVTDLIASYGLPVTWPRFVKKDWEQGLRRDKKMRGEDLNFVAVRTIGEVSVVRVKPAWLAKQLV